MKYSHNQRSLRLLLEIAAAFVLILALALPRLLALDHFVTTDERLWLERSGRFYYALAHRDFAATFQRSHPGVTVMWAGLTGYTRVYPEYRESYQDQDRPIGLGTLSKRDFNLPLRILAAGRRTMVLLHVLVLGLSFLFARRLFGTLPALAGFLLIAFDPFHIALSKVLHLDGLLANLMLLSLLAFLVYLEERKRTAFLVSAAAAGLAGLTKSTGLFLVPLIVLLGLLTPLYSRSDRGEAGWRKSVSRSVRELAAWGGIAALVFFLLWPAMWVDPVGSLVRIFTDAVGYAQGGHESPVFFNGKIYPGGEIPDLNFYPINFLWRTTPVTLLGLLAVPILLLRRKPVFPQDRPGSQVNVLHNVDRQKWAIAALLLFALGFSALMTLGLKKFDRYMMPSIVPLDLVAGIGLVWLVAWARQGLHTRWRIILTGVVLLGFVAMQATLAWKAFPYFFNYYNPLLGGSRQALTVMQIGWGEGLDQAARYINDKPNADQIRVMAWYAGGPFSYFSKSRVSALDVDHPWSAADWDEFNKSDYVVVYIHEWQRDLPTEVLDRLRGMTPEYSVWVDGLEYVRVYKIR
ncbi:MAG: glycosyltransferase family 39 protein [Anaerolineales bacterium]|nr:glycosyltransferase family 39 protein [Anaerolineales bacterium]